MKYVIIRCEDEARGSETLASLLEGAKTSHLLHLAQAGAAGVLAPPRKDRAGIDRLELHRALFGLGPREPDASFGRCYAESAGVALDEGDTAWCCELVTQRDGAIVDPTAGAITTKESESLIHALDEQLGSDARQWSVGRGAHHLLVAREAGLRAGGTPPVPSPELLVGQAWERHMPKGETGEALRGVIEQAAALLERHPVNRVRVDLGENPANMLWLWGATEAGPQRTFSERTRLSGAVASDSFLLRGFARTFGLGWKEGARALDEGALQRLARHVESLIGDHDLVYVHLQIATPDPVERLCAMERIDSLLLKPLTETLPSRGAWRLLAAIDDRNTRSVPVVAIGTGLPQHPIAALTAQRFAESPLAFQDGTELFAWLTQNQVRGDRCEV